MSRAELAEEICLWLWKATGKRYSLDERAIGRYERGAVQRPGASYRAALRHLFNATDTELGFTARPAPAAEPAAPAAAWDAASTCVEIETITEEDMATRRQAIKTALAGAVLTVPLQLWLVPSPRIDVHEGAELTLHEVRAMEQTARQVKALSSGALARRAIIAQLAEVGERLKHAPSGPLRARVFAAASILAETAASRSWDVGLHREAQRYYVLSVRLAHAAGNASLAAVALAALSRQCYDLGQPGDGLEVVQLAQYGTRRSASPRMRSMLATREAWSYAQRGEVGAFQRAVGLAQDYHADQVPDSDPYVSSFDEAELHGVIGARYRDLARFRPEHAADARHHIERALATRAPSREKNRVFDLVGLARAELIASEPERAATLVEQALPLAGQFASGRVGVKLGEFHREADRFDTVPAVREIRTAIRDLIVV
ncbi:MAG: hypothetical protein ACRDRL_33135 [Sciscionella sp.]